MSTELRTVGILAESFLVRYPMSTSFQASPNMFLQQLPDAVRWVLLTGFGAIIGALVNLAIYRLAMFQKRDISPWSPPPSETRRRNWLDRIPVVGWIFLRRESDVHGKGHWIRPMLIEIACAAGLLFFYQWQVNGGLFGGDQVKVVNEQLPRVGHWMFGWFFFHSVLFALMLVATFVDFDEQTIPDWITVPGALLALLGHALIPALRLPATHLDVFAVRLEPLNFWSPGPPQEWHTSANGLWIAILIVLIWCFALIPKWATLRFGLVRGVRIMFASILRRPRKTSSSIPRVTPRKMLVQTRVFLWLAVALTFFVVAIYMVGGERWTALFDSLLGLAMGGGVVWAVRIIASKALGVEAMGFGDVTLMCMIGAFLGWQPVLLAFAIAPFTSIIVAIVQLISSGENRLAFGPYLCIGTAIVVVGWVWVWNDWASQNVFALGGQFLLGVLLVCLVMMAVMLGVWGKIKYRD